MHWGPRYTLNCSPPLSLAGSLSPHEGSLLWYCWPCPVSLPTPLTYTLALPFIRALALPSTPFRLLVSHVLRIDSKLSRQFGFRRKEWIETRALKGEKPSCPTCFLYVLAVSLSLLLVKSPTFVVLPLCVACCCLLVWLLMLVWFWFFLVCW
jgi:hypothetical protein